MQLNHAGLGGPQVSFARRLRKDSTDTEKKLWFLLRSKQMGSYKFRRQHPIGPYVADFCCLTKRLVVELDGGQHNEEIEKDKKRTLYLSSKGFRVLRFWDNEVFNQTEGVLETILKTLEEGPSPCPLP